MIISGTGILYPKNRRWFFLAESSHIMDYVEKSLWSYVISTFFWHCNTIQVIFHFLVIVAFVLFHQPWVWFSSGSRFSLEQKWLMNCFFSSPFSWIQNWILPNSFLSSCQKVWWRPRMYFDTDRKYFYFVFQTDAGEVAANGCKLLQKKW